ncbi:uncharacterized protein LOC130667547 [Microplitis mediator]|uniref:uncharacterized protein LOC130667547 n=1 Tax=Microplitis mediator TaxID=375433 RepID=UPI0025573F1F|nr:uncharacterized protein LOC130667547 [Microplitis mediator]
MWKAKFLRVIECLKKKPGIVILLLPCLLVVTLYYISGKYSTLENYFPEKFYNPDYEIVDGYLVWSPKCHMLSENPMDNSISKYVKKKKFEPCSSKPLLTLIVKEADGNYSMVINSKAAKSYSKFICCWSSIVRVEPTKPLTDLWDSKINKSHCEDFDDRVRLPADIETVMVTCRSKDKPKNKKSNILYENIHAIVNPMKLKNYTDAPELNNKKISVLVLGIDSVSRLNFLRSLPQTGKYLRETGWTHLAGYNKMGDNTFPNLMAILTGQNSSAAYANCRPKEAYGLDNCSFLWYNFRRAGYVTAYGEDDSTLSTFNYQKTGFVDPPTDYYLRPYIVAAEKYLKAKHKYGSEYCTGPELAVDRIFNYALDFAVTFLDRPYFGFFWTNSVTHNDMNGASSLDSHLLDQLEYLERRGVFNNTLVIFLSDHGMRWGDIRNTFIGWYEERLPFVYLRIPDSLKNQNNEDSSLDIIQALKINEHRLTSPYDLYETLRDILERAGGKANSSSGCPNCQTLLKPVPYERSCEDAGVSPHWCTCTAFNPQSPTSKIAQQGAKTFLSYVESVIKDYKNHKGKRLCAKLKVKKIHRVNQIINLDNSTNSIPETTDTDKYFYLIELSPGGGLFETTVLFDKNGGSKMTEEEVSRINSYAKDSKCLDNGFKKYCYCIN